MNEDEINPWAVGNLEEFLYFCCPECDEKNQSRELFLEHALDQHPKAKECFSDVDVKQEPKEENTFDDYTDGDIIVYIFKKIK